MAKNYQYLQSLMMSETQDPIQHLLSPEPVVSDRTTAYKTLLEF